MEGAEKAAGDKFILEDLLDFSNEEEAEEGGGWCFNGGSAGNSTDDSSTVTAVESCGNSFSNCGSCVTGELPFRSFAENVLCGLVILPFLSALTAGEGEPVVSSMFSF